MRTGPARSFSGTVLGDGSGDGNAGTPSRPSPDRSFEPSAEADPWSCHPAKNGDSWLSLEASRNRLLPSGESGSDAPGDIDSPDPSAISSCPGHGRFPLACCALWRRSRGRFHGG